LLRPRARHEHGCGRWPVADRRRVLDLRDGQALGRPRRDQLHHPERRGSHRRRQLGRPRPRPDPARERDGVAMKLWKVQKFFEDVVYDLRNRGLLPVVILLVIALAAVPILISRGGGSKSSTSSAPPASASVQPAPETEQAVLSYAPPGIRKYGERLHGDAKDPFRDQASPADVAATAQASALSSTVTVPTSSESSSISSSSTGSTPPSGSSSGGGGTTHTLYLYRSVADISVGDVTQPLERHKHIEPFTSLPNQVAPVLIYLGSSLTGKHAYFSISKSIDPLTGDGTCAPSPTDCTLLALGVGQSEDLTYTVDGKTYRVKLNKINLVRKRVPSN